MSMWFLMAFWLLVVVVLTVVLNRKSKQPSRGLPGEAGSPMAYYPASAVPARPAVPVESGSLKVTSRFDHETFRAPAASSMVAMSEPSSRQRVAQVPPVHPAEEVPARKAAGRRKAKERVLLEVHVQRVKEPDQTERLRLSRVVVGGEEVLPPHLRPNDVFDERTHAWDGSSSASRRLAVSRRAPSAEAQQRPDGVPTRGLVIQAEPLEKILAGRKTLELRSKHNRQLGPVALIRKGSGLIYGVADIVESVGPMNLDEMYRRASEHGVEPYRIQDVIDKGWNIGWRLAKVQCLAKPVPYVHKGMSQVRLDEDAVTNLAIALRASRDA